MQSRALTPPTRDLLLIGGGHAHAIVLRRFAMKPLPGARLTLVNPDPVAFYSGMLPGFVAGAYDRDAISIDLIRLARWAGARIVLDTATAIEPDAQRVLLGSGRALDYDLLSVNAGSTSDTPAIADPDGALVPVKPLSGFMSGLDAFVAAVSDGRQAPTARVIGAGVGGVELALALKARLSALGAPGIAGKAIDIALIEHRDTPLAALEPGPRRAVLRALAERGVRIRTGVEIVSAAKRAQGVVLTESDGAEETVGVAFVAAGARAPGLIAGSGLATDAQGFIAVDRFLTSISHETVFAAGDCAAMLENPRAKAGVFAVRQGAPLADNLEAALRGRRLRPYRPQRTWLKLLNLGGGRALGEKGGIAFDGPPLVQRALWAWKDWIDRRFMQRFEPPATPRPAAPDRAALGVAEAAETGMLCGGCGSKVGEGALRTALAALGPAPAIPGAMAVLQGVGDDAAVLKPEGAAPLVWTTDHFRAFVADPWLLARIAVIHALGDIRAMGATPSAALLSLTLEEAAPPLQGRDLAAALAGARSALDPAGAALVGGHSALGAELATGVSALGVAPTERWIGLGGAEAGDALILTRPIGLGTVLAGEMAMWAKPWDVAGAWAMMAQDKGAEAALLAPHARAMTDVTGFGLGGHLLSMIEASGVDAELDLDSIPLIDGAAALAGAGVESSVARPNRLRLDPALEADALARAHPCFPLLVDPQTAGGFLAAVPPADAPAILAALDAVGVPAARIGATTPRRVGAPTIALRA